MAQEKKLCLLIQVPGHVSRQVALKGDSYRLGRSNENDIILPYREISRQHGLLQQSGGSWQYTDLDSTNGSYVNNQRIHQLTLQEGVQLRLGRHPRQSVFITFKADIGGEIPEMAGNRELSSDRTPVRVEGEPAITLVQIQEFQPDSHRPITIGRDPQADILLKSPVVSRRHALLQPSGEEWLLVDLNSHNGTVLNGKNLVSPQQLVQGDLVQIGGFRLVYQGQGGLKIFAPNLGMRLDCQGLTWEVGTGKNRKRILDDISLSCKSQEFVALVGGSGAGKTTLIKALAGMLPTQGRVLVEGDDLYQNFNTYRSQIGYVPQENILHRQLTVWQALWYSAKLRLPPDVSESEIQQRIEKVLEQVELSGQKHQVIHSLSGGQRKRASIAVELLADPPLLFLDEPTTGLDPGLEKKMMVTLRHLANDGKTIVMVTHATANITACDQVAFISMGRLVYFGPPQQAGEFFEVGTSNFADIYAEIGDPTPQLANIKADDWEKRFRKSPFYQKYILERLERLPEGGQRPGVNRSVTMKQSWTSSIRQFFLLTRRYFDLIMHDRILLIVLFAIMPLLALLVLLITGPNWLIGDSTASIEQQLQANLANGGQSATYSMTGNCQALLFIFSLAAVLLGLFASAYEIVKERTIYERERMVFLSLPPYLGSKLVLLMGFASVQCLFFLVVIGFKLHFPQAGMFLPAFAEIYLTLLIAALGAILLGLLLSSIAPNSNVVVYFILGVLFLQILFAGALFQLPGGAGQLSKITLTRWSTEALGITTDIKYLDSLTTTRFIPGTVTQDVSMDVETPDPNWIPVTITTEKKLFPGCSQAVPVPVVTQNKLVTTQETITKTVTVTPNSMDVHFVTKFVLDYSRNAVHLLEDWGILLGLGLLCGAGTIFILKKRDIV